MKAGGVQQETIYRSKDGRKIDESERLLSEKDRLKIANEKLLAQWKGGAKQAYEVEERKQAMIEARDKPFANYEMDQGADQDLRDKDRFGDPLKLIKSSTMRSSIT